MAPFHIKAQILRKSQLEPATALGFFEPRPGEEDAPAGEAETRVKARWRQTDIKRAIAAAEQAGLEAYRVEIAPDGTIAIIVGSPAETAADANPYGDLLRP